MKNIIYTAAAILWMTCGAYAGTAAEQLGLDAGRGAQAAGLPVPAPDFIKTTDELNDSFAVPYRVAGKVIRTGGGFSFSASDGRAFRLLPANPKIYGQAERLARTGTAITLDGCARRLDDLSALRADAFLPYAAGIAQTWRDKTQREARLVQAGSAGELTIKNVRWGKQPDTDAYDWRTGVIDPELVDKVYIVQKPLEPEFLVSHATMLFTFKAGGMNDSAGNTSRGLLLSVESMLRPDKEADLVSALNKEYGIVWLLATEEDYIKFTCLTEDKKLFPYELQLSAAQKRALLRNALTQAVVDRSGEYYHTITNNCTITLIQLLNKVLPEAKRIRLFYAPWLYNPEAFSPNGVFSNLVLDGIAAPHMPELTPANYRNTALWPG